MPLKLHLHPLGCVHSKKIYPCAMKILLPRFSDKNLKYHLVNHDIDIKEYREKHLGIAGNLHSFKWQR